MDVYDQPRLDHLGASVLRALREGVDDVTGLRDEFGRPLMSLSSEGDLHFVPHL